MPTVLIPEDISTLRDHIEALEPNPDAFDRRTSIEKHIKTVFNRDPHFIKYLDMEPVASVAERLMGDDCHIIGMTAWTTGPDRPDQHLHADYLPVEIPEEFLLSGAVKLPVFVATAHYYLNDIYNDLGPTKFIPGSHLAGRKPTSSDRTWRGMEEQDLICNAGRLRPFPVGCMASRIGQHQRRDTLSAAGSLCPADDHAEVPTISSILSTTTPFCRWRTRGNAGFSVSTNVPTTIELCAFPSRAAADRVARLSPRP